MQKAPAPRLPALGPRKFARVPWLADAGDGRRPWIRLLGSRLERTPDANLGGDPVDEIAAALTRKGIPFAFATGYGREALPHGFRDRPVITKPFRDSPLSLYRALRSLNPSPYMYFWNFDDFQVEPLK